MVYGYCTYRNECEYPQQRGSRYQGSPTTPHSDRFRKIRAEHRAETRFRSGTEKVAKGRQRKPSLGDATGPSDPITTKSLASDGGLEEILKKIGSAG